MKTGTLIINKKKHVVLEEKEFNKLQLLAAQKSASSKNLMLAVGKKYAYNLIKVWEDKGL